MLTDITVVLALQEIPYVQESDNANISEQLTWNFRISALFFQNALNAGASGESARGPTSSVLKAYCGFIYNSSTPSEIRINSWLHSNAILVLNEPKQKAFAANTRPEL